MSKENQIFSTISDKVEAHNLILTEQQLSGYKLAQKKLEVLLQEHSWIAPEQLEQSFARIVGENASARSKRKKVIEIANRVTKVLSPYVACKEGCSGCCHMNTMIYEHEAIHLAKVTGRKMAHLTYRPLNVVFKKGNGFIGKPCPFLLKNKCSVYADRPLVCRTHHSLAEDAKWCSIEIFNINRIGPPMYEPDMVEIPYRQLNAVYSPLEPWGNINEFFPEL